MSIQKRFLEEFAYLDSTIPHDYSSYINFCKNTRMKYINKLNLIIDDFIAITETSKVDGLKLLKKEHSNACYNLQFALLDNISNRMTLQDNYKSRMDPAVMGGIVNGLLGPSAGIYSAYKTTENNNNLKRNTEILESRVSAYEKEIIKNFEYYWDLTKQIFFVLFEHPEFDTLYNKFLKRGEERLREENYQKAKNLLAKKEYEEAYKIFETLGDYKDSKQILKASKNRMILGISLFIAMVVIWVVVLVI